MVEVRQIINERVEERLGIIENKLRNSFKFLKKDFDDLKNQIDLLNKKAEKIMNEAVSKKELETSIQQQRDYFLKENSSMFNNFQEKQKKLQEEIKKFNKIISEKKLEKEIKQKVSCETDKKFQEQQEKQKKEIEKIQEKYDKKIQTDFSKYDESKDDLKKEFVMFKNEFVGLRDEVGIWKKDIGKELKDLLDEKEQQYSVEFQELKSQINSLKARNTVLTKELNSLKGNGSKELIKEIKSSEDKKEKKVVVKKQKKTGFWSFVVDKLSDEEKK